MANHPSRWLHRNWLNGVRTTDATDPGNPYRRGIDVLKHLVTDNSHWAPLGQILDGLAERGHITAEERDDLHEQLRHNGNDLDLDRLAIMQQNYFQWIAAGERGDFAKSFIKELKELLKGDKTPKEVKEVKHVPVNDLPLYGGNLHADDSGYGSDGSDEEWP
jgi:hypothetical protein